jgi:hypothetical protein
VLTGIIAARRAWTVSMISGTDKLTVTFTLRAATDADAIRSAGLARSPGRRSGDSLDVSRSSTGG